jgi:hypothetical protein
MLLFTICIVELKLSQHILSCIVILSELEFLAFDVVAEDAAFAAFFFLLAEGLGFKIVVPEYLFGNLLISMVIFLLEVEFP